MSSDLKKDLTGLMDYAKSLEDSGHAPPVPEGSVMEEQKIEKFEQFESLDEYGKANPPSETSPESFGGDFAVTPVEPGTGLQSLATMDAEAPEPIPDDISSAFEAPPPPDEPMEMAHEPIPEPPAEFSDSPPDSEEQIAATAEPKLPSALAVPLDAPDFSDQISVSSPAVLATEQPEMTEPLRPALRTPRPAQAPLDKVREYSEQMSPSKTSVPASFPFSLLITGFLAPEEQARLLDLLSRENMGVREIDLEPQFESGKILIPRISEYAGVLIVSALRSARVKLRFGPSDSIFATEDTQDTNAGSDSGLGQSASHSASSHPAEELPITTESVLPGRVREAVTQLIDVVTASAALKTTSIEAEHSPEYQMLLETLQRELKYKAFHKGATAIVSFSVQLTQLRQPTHYRVLVTGSAVKG